MRTLTSEQSSVDRSGAAQGLAEVLGGMGLARMQSILPEFIHSAENPAVQPHARDGYLMLFIYLPEVFRSEFSPFIAMVLSPILMVGFCTNVSAIRFFINSSHYWCNSQVCNILNSDSILSNSVY